MKRLIGFAGFLLCVALPTTARSQQPSTTTALAFDVVSIKPEAAGAGPGSLISLGCRGKDAADPSWRVTPMAMCIGSQATAERILTYAYEIGFALNVPLKGTIVGEPDWFNKDTFALQAKAENPPTLKELRSMLQTMLADRFKLRSHIEMKEMDGFALVVGKNGPKLEEASPEELRSGMLAPARQRTKSSLQQASGGEVNPGITAGLRIHGGVPGIASRAINYVNVTMDYVARGLCNGLGRPVINKTGLEGNYNLITRMYALPGDTDLSSPTLPEVLGEVGLQLVSQKVSVPVLVIDHVEKPTFD